MYIKVDNTNISGGQQLFILTGSYNIYPAAGRIEMSPLRVAGGRVRVKGGTSDRVKRVLQDSTGEKAGSISGDFKKHQHGVSHMLDWRPVYIPHNLPLKPYQTVSGAVCLYGSRSDHRK